MYNTAYFSRMPKTEYPGTRMKKPQIVSGTSLHGKVIPLFCNLVMPGTIDSNIVNGSIWMSTPIAPIMSQIKGSINVFFVPLRLVWEHTKEFFGENKTSSGPQQVQYKIPGTELNRGTVNNFKTDVTQCSVSHYLGKPLKKSGDAYDANTPENRVSYLKERAYWLVISEFYRHQQTQNPVLLSKADAGNLGSATIGTLDGNILDFQTQPFTCLKDFDYFTTGTTSPNYGGEILLPLGSSAPIKAGTTLTSLGGPALMLGNTSSGFSGTYNLAASSGGYVYQGSTSDAGTKNTSSNRVYDTNLYADLSSATAAKIDDLYTAMAAQAWYHNANFGSRYFEMLQIHYGVSNPDLVLDRPEHVSEFKFDISVQDVVSQAGATNDDTTKLGQPGAVSKTYIRKHLYHHSFGEWGFVIGLFNTYHQRYYSAGVAREDLYEDLFDFYFPEFANRSDDSIMFNEVYYKPNLDGKAAFAYQEAYADRRYYQSRVTGLLDPYCDSSVNGASNPIGRWVLAEKWANRPSFGSQFLSEDREAISEALVTGEEGPDFIWAFNFEHTEVLPMPAYSKPGVPSFGRGLL